MQHRDAFLQHLCTLDFSLRCATADGPLRAPVLVVRCETPGSGI